MTEKSVHKHEIIAECPLCNLSFMTPDLYEKIVNYSKQPFDKELFDACMMFLNDVDSFDNIPGATALIKGACAHIVRLMLKQTPKDKPQQGTCSSAVDCGMPCCVHVGRCYRSLESQYEQRGLRGQERTAQEFHFNLSSALRLR